MLSPFQFGEKTAIEVTRGGLGSRALASTLGHAGGFPVMTMLSLKSHVNPTDWQGASGEIWDSQISPTDTRANKHKQLADAMAQVNPQELKDTRVYLGGPNLIEEYKRLYKNPRSSVLGKIHAGLTLPITTGMINLTRGSAYHPTTDSVYLMGDKPGVLSHELGHALDFNRFKVPDAKPGDSGFRTWMRRQGYGLGRDLYAASRMLPVLGGLMALPQETAANALSLKNIQKAYKDNPEALNKLLDDRQKVLPGGMGSYIGGAAAGVVDPTGLLQAPAAISGALAGKIYGMAKHIQSKGKYVKEKAKPKDANKDNKEDNAPVTVKFPTKDKDQDQDQPKRQKAANFADDYAHYFNKDYNPIEHGLDVRLPNTQQALRQMLIATAVGGGMGLGRGMLWPGYIEHKDEQGRIVAKKKRSPLLGALEGAALGAGSSALSSYAGQTLSQYNPEIDKILQGAKGSISSLINNPGRGYGVDINPRTFAKLT
jgi:hypothetical protein